MRGQAIYKLQCNYRVPRPDALCNKFDCNRHILLPIARARLYYKKMHKLVSQPDPSLCARCHEEGRGCCRASEEGLASMFGLTMGEVALISQVSGLKPDQFSVADRASEEFLEFLDSIHPLFRQTMPEGRRRRLRLDAGYACVFLSPQGCRLPTPARPLYCRLYPFWLTPQGGRLMVLRSELCMAQEGARSWREVMLRLDQDEGHLRQLFGRMVELAAEHEAAGGELL